jgi:hypothetical protein
MRSFKSCVAMHKLFKAYTALLLLAIVACGMNSNRTLMSMTISPSSADAQNFVNGQAKFTATGNFSQPPSPAPVTFMEPYTGSWSSSNPQIATIDQNGVAHCGQGATGTVTISAIVSSNSANAPAMSMAVSAAATLNCP